jgi:FAD:protein FMN transferase
MNALVSKSLTTCGCSDVSEQHLAMKPKLAITLFTALFLLTSALPITKEKATRQYVSHFENVLGTSLELKMYATSENAAAHAEAVALEEIKRISKIVSGYDTESEFSRWMETSNESMPVSQELFEVLGLFDKWRMNTHGALDASAETVSRMWKAAERNQQLPTAEELNAAVERVRQPHWKLDYTRHTATKLTDVPLLLNSFTKSYIINKAVDVAMKSGDVKSLVMNIGGDIVVRGDNAETIELRDPRVLADNAEPVERMRIYNKAIATSGNYKRGIKIGNQWYSHIVDPRTARPVDHVISATVVATDPTDAGALATAFNVLSMEESTRLALTIPGVEYFVITKDGDRIQSKGWIALRINEEPVIVQSALRSGSSDASGKAWDSQYELVIDLELSAFQYSRRPFVAVWIEKDNVPVRNLAIWFNKPRWIPELRRWYRMNGEKMTAPDSKINSVASATRMPGKYTLLWDGKDDQGNLVDAGTYTVFIEAAREHGTYQIISQEIEVAGKPYKIDLKGNVEIASASIDYRKKQ